MVLGKLVMSAELVFLPAAESQLLQSEIRLQLYTSRDISDVRLQKSRRPVPEGEAAMPFL
jgi:hypothetical protein